jgi:imidazoleglycerol-phosphate dehydratase
MTMTQRTARIERKTKETDIVVEMNLDGAGTHTIDTGVGFLDHMLSHVSQHGHIDLAIRARGDLHVDAHHTVEDVAICMGEALRQALGDKKGIARYGNSAVPMEDALANLALDLSGRPYCVYRATFPTEKIGEFDCECLEEFLRALSNTARLNLHVTVPYGTNSHHIAEAIFKALGQALAQAVRITGGDVPSTKGIL